jgi:hypothetical protein
MIECIVVAIVVKLMPSFSTNAITLGSKSNISNTNKSYKAMDYLVILFISNNPITICMNTHVSFKNLIIKTKVSTLAQNIQRSKLEMNIIANARFGKNMLIHYLFDHVKQHFFH